MLDFAAVAAQMQALFTTPAEGRRSPEQAIAQALEVAEANEEGARFNAVIHDAVRNGKIPDSWHPALLLDEGSNLRESHPAPEAPPAYCIAATDGSQIYPDFHQIADCYLLNISRITLYYGGPDVSGNAILDAEPQFFYGVPGDSWQEALKAGFPNREFVDARRHVAELDELASVLEEVQQGIPTVGLCDGIFDLRVSAAQNWRDWAVEENERALDRLRTCGHPVGGYIAASRATDVITALQVVMGGEAAGESLAGLSDARLFDALLGVGHRSATFRTLRGTPRRDNRMGGASSQNAQFSDTSRHATCFFYLKTQDGEVARLEFPHWVTEHPGWLDVLHAVTMSQIEKGDGYPIALMEAHEHAVVRAAERDTFYLLIEDAMLANGLQPKRSAKGRSKNRPLV